MENAPPDLDTDTSEVLDQLMRNVKEINTEENASKVALELIMTKISEVTTYRTDRYMNSTDYITPPMRVLLQAFSAAIIAFLILMFIGDLSLWLHILIAGVTATALATLYEVILELNKPFGGSLWNLWKSTRNSLMSLSEDFKKLEH